MRSKQLLNQLQCSILPVNSLKKAATSSQITIQKINSSTQLTTKRSSNRNITDYQSNVTAALALPMTTDELNTLNKNLETLLYLSREHILEHASRRIDLFFYLLIAYFQTQAILKQTNTQSQHGRGRSYKTGMTHACHSSFFPALIDDKSKPASKYKATHKIKLPDNYKTVKKYSSLLDNCHFSDSLNSTVELPRCVNNLDSYLEGKINNPSTIRKETLFILQKVSQGLLNPVEGIEHFVNQLLENFDAMEKKQKNNYLLKFHKNISTNSKSYLLQLQKAALSQILTKNKVKKEYIEMLLRLTAVEKAICKQNPKIQQQIYRDRIFELQEEILTTRNQLR